MEPYRNKFSDNRALQKLFERSICNPNARAADIATHNSSAPLTYNPNAREETVKSSTLDSCTQTSKTIIQLAKLEIAELPEDSLNNTPRRDTVNDNEVFKQTTGFRHQSLNVRDVWKNKIVENAGNSCKQTDFVHDNLKLGKSLTQTFLENKSKSKKLHEKNVKRVNNLQNFAATKSKFLLQTSPLKNVTSISDIRLVEHSVTSTQHSPFTMTQDGVTSAFAETAIPLEQNDTTTKQQLTKRIFHVNASSKTPVDMTHPPNLTVNKVEVPALKFCSSVKTTTANKTFVRSNSFMQPTISSKMKSQKPFVEVRISPTRRGRSVSPTLSSRDSPKKISAQKAERRTGCADNTTKIPYIDEEIPINFHSEEKELFDLTDSCALMSSSPRVYSHFLRKQMSPPFNKTDIPQEIGPQKPNKNATKGVEDTLQISKMKIANKASNESVGSTASKMSGSNSSTSSESTIEATMAKLRSQDWNCALQGLSEVIGLCGLLEPDILHPYMPNINRRLIDLLRSPRSHVCRTACQAAGHLFEFMKDTRRPEFDDIVELLLFKTADANKFIRQDANLSLDCMVTHIPTFHAIRALCTKGPTHKNSLVRTATVRLVVCAVVISGTDYILNQNASDCTKKRIATVLSKYFTDTCQEARKYAERLYKILYKHPNFDSVVKKFLDKEEMMKVKSYVKNIQKSNLGSF